MSEILKDGAKLFLKTIIVTVLSVIVVVSIIALSVAVFAEDEGYVAYGVKETTSSSETAEPEELYTHYLEDGKDLKLENYEKQGYTVTKQHIKKLTPSANNLTLIIAQFFTLGILISFVYPNLWDKGNKDYNAVRCGRKTEDKLKGLKIGLVATAPSAIIAVVMFVLKGTVLSKLPIALYRMLYAQFYPLITFIAGKSESFAQLNFGQFLLILSLSALIPLIAQIGYILGYKDISLSERFTYKKIQNRR